MTPIDVSIGRQIKRAAKARRITLKELAYRTGMNYGALWRSVNGQRHLFAEELERCAEELGMSVDCLLNDRFVETQRRDNRGP